MAWTAPKTWTNAVLTAAELNTHVRDNLNETAPGKVTTAGDIVYATGANTITRLGIGTGLQLFRTNAGATAPEWVDPSSALQTLGLLAAGRLTGAATSFTLSSYGNYRRLMLLVWIEYAATSGGDITMRINNISAGNYSSQNITAIGATLTSASLTSQTAITVADVSAIGGAGGGKMGLVAHIFGDGAATDAFVVHASLVRQGGSTGDPAKLQHTTGYLSSTAQYPTQLDVIGGSNDLGAGTHYALYGSDDVA